MTILNYETRCGLAFGILCALTVIVVVAEHRADHAPVVGDQSHIRHQLGDFHAVLATQFNLKRAAQKRVVLVPPVHGFTAERITAIGLICERK